MRTGSLLPVVSSAALPAETTRTRTGRPEVPPETRAVSSISLDDGWGSETGGGEAESHLVNQYDNKQVQ